MYTLEDMEYNTGRNSLIMREYGRHIQKMIEYLLSIEDKEVRQRNAYAVIELMGFLNPQKDRHPNHQASKDHSFCFWIQQHRARRRDR